MPTLYAGGALGPGYGTVPNKTLLSFSLSLARSLALSLSLGLKSLRDKVHTGMARPDRG